MPIDSKSRGNHAAVKPLDDAAAPEPKTSTCDTAPVFAIVTGCVRLNLREAASPGASVLKELPVSTKVQVDVNGSTEDFYHVQTFEGTDGYCMKKYLKLLP